MVVSFLIMTSNIGESSRERHVTSRGPVEQCLGQLQSHITLKCLCDWGILLHNFLNWATRSNLGIIQSQKID